MKTIQVDRDIYQYLSARAAETGESPGLVLLRELGVPPPTEALEIGRRVLDHGAAPLTVWLLTATRARLLLV